MKPIYDKDLVFIVIMEDGTLWKEGTNKNDIITTKYPNMATFLDAVGTIKMGKIFSQNSIPYEIRPLILKIEEKY